MANSKNNNNAYDKIENIIMEKVFSLERDNARLKSELDIATAKLEVYERIVNLTNSKIALGFEPPIVKN